MPTAPSSARRTAAVLGGLAVIATGLVGAATAGPADAAGTARNCKVSSTGVVSVLGVARGTLTRPVVRTDGVTITGTPGPDVIYATGDRVRIEAGDGDDVVCVSGASPHVDGGDGADLIASDTVRSGSRLIGGFGGDTFVPGAGGGTIRTNLESPTLPRPPVTDPTRVDPATNLVIVPPRLDRRLRVAGYFGSAFDGSGDVLNFRRLHSGVRMASSTTGSGVRSVDVPGRGTLAFDTVPNLIGTNHDDVLVADGARTVDAGKGDDVVRAAESDAEVVRDRTLVGGPGRDTVTYRQIQITANLAEARVNRFSRVGDFLLGRDTVTGFYRLVGSRFDDLITGSSGRNVLEGGAGYDAIFGGGGADTLEGDSGRDRLYGEDGADVLDGGTGKDLCDGGPGKDRKIRC